MITYEEYQRRPKELGDSYFHQFAIGGAKEIILGRLHPRELDKVMEDKDGNFNFIFGPNRKTDLGSAITNWSLAKRYGAGELSTACCVLCSVLRRIRDGEE